MCKITKEELMVILLEFYQKIKEDGEIFTIFDAYEFVIEYIDTLDI